MSNKSGTSSQIIGLPQGGGAVHGIGEKFNPDLHSGTGNFTVPIALPAGRNGFQPGLSLVYSSGGGNGAFGLGWSLNVPGVMRKTSNGLPRYDDSLDTFVLSGAEDLVAVEERNGVDRYRPRTEGLFARIVHHSEGASNYWRVDSKDGLSSYYGTPASDGSATALIGDPEAPSRIFAWKLSRTVDPFGNRIDYLYQRDANPAETARRWAQLYLSEVRYADYGDPANPQFLVRVRFIYEQRPDPFSDYRAGFEIRTVKRCTRIEIYTAAERERLVSTYHLDYLDRKADAELPLNHVSLLDRIRVEGHDGTASEFLPSLQFGYSRFVPGGQTFFAVQGDLPPVSLAHPEYELADVFGNGLPDIVQINGTARYWRNLGDGRFDTPRMMSEAPSGVNLGDAGVQLIDADGDGRIDLLVQREEMSGYFPLRYGGKWDKRAFQRYGYAPSFDFQDPELKLVDLTGDGVTDALRSGSRFECFFNDRKLGWHSNRSVERGALDEFPNLNFSDPRVKWGDFSGDGLQDIALVHDGHVSYWPNLGYGDWGARIVMGNAPRLPHGYDPKRILIDDVDGDGLADIVYVDERKVWLWINQSGNRWSDAIEISGTPTVADIDAVRLVDLLGSGHRGLVWSRDADGTGRPHMHFLDFCGGVKPYLLRQIDNGMGASIAVAYAPSTRFYLTDQQDPHTRWLTPLPMPVQVVAKIEVIDRISQGKLTSEFSYHHGYWDGAEREFRGFGRVDRRDTEVFDGFHSAGLHGGDGSEPAAAGQFSPPLETRTWFHQGPVGDEFGNWEELDCSAEYWSGDPNALIRPPALLAELATLPRRRRRDALRAMRGSVLRTELYALDGSVLENRPFTVSETLPGVREHMAPASDHGLGVYFAFTLAQRTTQWERGADPLTRLGFMGEYDVYGRLLAQLEIAVPRGRDYRSVADSAKPYLATLSETVYLQRDDQQRYVIDRVGKVSRYQIADDGRETAQVLWERVSAGQADKELIGQTLNFYDGPGFNGLAFGRLGDYGALTRSENLVMSEALLRDLCRSADMPEQPAAASSDIPPYLKSGRVIWSDDYPDEFRNLPPLAGYVFRSANAGAISAAGYFAISASHLYDFQVSGANGKGRGLLLQQHDPMGRRGIIVYDRYQVLPIRHFDPLGLKTEAVYDYRVLKPSLVSDANGNVRRFRYTPLGLLQASFVQDKIDAAEGDRSRAGTELSYDLQAFGRSGQPVSVRTRHYQYHDSDTEVPLPLRDQTIDTVEFTDGFGRLLQTRAQAEEVRYGDPVFGDGLLPAAQDDPATRDAFAGSRSEDAGRPYVRVSGWQIYDNKGRVVEKYEAFFSEGWDYAPPGDEQRGRKALTFYDSRGRSVRTVNPDGSEQRVVYGIPYNLSEPDGFSPTPWEVYTYDANDNAGRTHADASTGYRRYWNTPVSVVTDALGRTVESTVRNGADPADWQITRSDYDIRDNLLSVTDALGRLAFRYHYDLLNRAWRTESIDAGWQRTVPDALGHPLERQDAKGARVLHQYDIANRPERLWASDGSSQPMTLREVLVYGDREQAAGLDADTAKQRNLLGRLFRHYDEAGLLQTDAYDFKGNPISQIRRVIDDRQLLAAVQPAAGGDWNVDAYRIDWRVPAGKTLADRAEALLDPAEFRIDSRYDALNRIKSMLYPQDVNGQRQQLLPVYNRGGALTQLQLNGQNYVREIAYNAKGQRLLIAYGNGVMTRYAYDIATFRLLRLRSERYGVPGEEGYRPVGEAIQDYAYRYDLAGNILHIQERIAGCGILNNPEAAAEADPALKQLLAGGDALVRRFDYDPLYRLVSASGRECDQAPETPPWLDLPRCTDLTRTRAYRQRYAYDALGNLLEMRHSIQDGNRNRQFANSAGSNRLESVTAGQSVIRYAFDPCGNLLAEQQTRLFDWDYCDRLKAFRIQAAGAEPSVCGQYLYDSSGMRVKKLVRKQGGQYLVTVYIGGLFEYHRSVQGVTVKENNSLHVMDDRARIALLRVGLPFSDDDSPAVKYQLADHLGSGHIVLSGDGAWLSREEYTPYGDTSFGGFARKRYRFCGKERDEESGMNYHAARYYAPWLGRWVSADPEGMLDGLNLYCYVRCNPLKLTDVEGTDSQEAQDPNYCFNESITRESNPECFLMIDIVATPKSGGAGQSASATGNAAGNSGAGNSKQGLANGGNGSGANGSGAGSWIPEALQLAVKALSIAIVLVAAWEVGIAMAAIGSFTRSGVVAAVQQGAAAATPWLAGFLGINAPRAVSKASSNTSAAEAAESGATWQNLPGGMRIQKVGSEWVKEVNPEAGRFARWWGRGSLDAQAKALDKLGDMAPGHTYENGRLVTADAGSYTPGNFWRTWFKGSLRLRTPFNDIRPRNIGANGLIFDPAKHPIQQSLEAITFFSTLAGAVAKMFEKEKK